MNTKYLCLEEVSKMLNLAKSTVYSYVGNNKIPYIKLGGKLLFNETDLTGWLDSKKQPVIEREGTKR
jgi:excisionase family DNA binding protein